MPGMEAARSLAARRLALGLGQGAALYLLYLAFDEKRWPATSGEVFTPLLIVALFVPLLALQALGNMRGRTLAWWIAAASIVLSGLAFYDIWRAWPVDWVITNAGTGKAPTYGWRPHVLPSWQLIVAVIAGLFIGHALIAGGDSDRKFMASYATHFDVAWKLGLQLALSAAFVGVFWLLLWLGAALFALIKLDFLSRLYHQRWFWIPASTLALAAAIHATDVRANLVRGTRVLALTLLSWLLPVATLLVAGFLVALVFRGLGLLWSTRFAAALLLTTATILIVLICATYQEGGSERTPTPALRIAGRIAALLLVPLVALAGYALALRVTQYGWTVDRIMMAAIILIAGWYAAGYAGAALLHGPWLKLVERWNFYAALLILATLLALFTPIADPARIAVASQVARLNNGSTPAGKFDFTFLRWGGGRFGQKALEQMKQAASGPDAQLIRATAARALEATSRYGSLRPPQQFTRRIEIHTATGTLPASFLNQDWRSADNFGQIPACLTMSTNVRCDAFMVDLKGDGTSEIMIVQNLRATGFQVDATGRWRVVGQWLTICPNLGAALRAGKVEPAKPEPAPWPDLEVMGQRLRFIRPYAPPSCPP
jgi:hypothetical protein